MREAERSGRVPLFVCLGVRAEQCSPPYGVWVRARRVIIATVGCLSPPSVAGYHPSRWLIITPLALLVAGLDVGDGACFRLAVYLPCGA